MSNKILCPFCWHEETLKARLSNRECLHDDPAFMLYVRPYGGACGQIVTKWDDGHFMCNRCEIRLTQTEAGVFLDAALMCSDPNCDSIRENMHEDVRTVFDYKVN